MEVSDLSLKSLTSATSVQILNITVIQLFVIQFALVSI